MKKTITNESDYMYKYISDNLSRGTKIAVPAAILDQEGLDLEEMGEYYIVERGSFGLVNFVGFRRALL